MTTTEQINKITDAQIEAAGYVVYNNYGDHFTAVAPLLYGAGCIIYATSLEGIDNQWHYETLHGAVFALYIWDVTGTNEPEGWARHPGTGRRRENGDADKETVKP